MLGSMRCLSGGAGWAGLCNAGRLLGPWPWLVCVIGTGPATQAAMAGEGRDNF